MFGQRYLEVHGLEALPHMVVLLEQAGDGMVAGQLAAVGTERAESAQPISIAGVATVQECQSASLQLTDTLWKAMPG